MKPESVSPYSNVIARRRTKDGDPTPRRLVYLPPLVTHDAEALREIGEVSRQSLEDAARHVPWLLSQNAVAAAENVRVLRQDMVSSVNEHNDKAQGQVVRLQREVGNVIEKESAKASELASALAPLGIGFRPEEASLVFSEDEPVSMEELAGEHNLPSPSACFSVALLLFHKLVAVIGSGSVLGISLGLLTDKIELYSMAEEWLKLVLFSLVGIVVMLLIGWIVFPLATAIGGELFRARRRSAVAPWLVPCIHGLLLIGIAISIVVIEAKVEQAGLFKALNESAGLGSVTLSKAELVWVSLMLTLPTVGSHLCLGLLYGESKAVLAHLRSLQRQARRELIKDPRFEKACRLHQELVRLTQRRTDHEARVRDLLATIRDQFTVEELRRLEDQEMDAAATSYAAEDALRAKSSPTIMRRRTRRSFWQWLLRALP